MAEDKQEEKFDFTAEGEAVGFVTIDQARFVAMQTAQREPGNYGPTWQSVPMVFEVIDAVETEDDYALTLSFRPEGEFTGTPGREQFVIRDKLGEVTFRQVLTNPKTRGRLPFPMIVAGGAGIIGVLAIIVAVLASGGGDDVPVEARIAANTPVPTPTVNTVVVAPPTRTSTNETLASFDKTTPLPNDTSVLTPSADPKSTAIPKSPPTAMPVAASKPQNTPPASPTRTPIPTPNVVAVSAGIVVSDSELLSQTWVQGAHSAFTNYNWGSGGKPVTNFSVSPDDVTLFASDYSSKNGNPGILYKSSDGGRTWLTVGPTGQCMGRSRAQDLIFDMNDPQRILDYCSGWQQSEDGGDSWILSDFAPPGTPIIYGDVIYAGGRFRSEDGGQTWRELITEHRIFQGTPGYPSALYANRTHTIFSIDIFLSKDGTVTWDRIETPQAKDEPYFIFTFDSSNPPNLVLGFPEEGLFRANALDPKDWELLSWPPSSAGLKEVALHPTDPDVLAFTDDDDGVFITFDGADSWVPLHQAGYQIGNVVHNGLPLFSGGRRPLVVTGGPRPTVCIGSDAGPWCHTMVVTSGPAPTLTLVPTPTARPTFSPIPTGPPRVIEVESAAQATPTLTPPLAGAFDIALGYFTRGKSFYDAEQYGLAIDEFTSVIQIYPEFTLAYWFRAMANVNLNQYQQAIEDNNEYIRLKPQDAKAYNNRAISYSRLGEDKRAIQDYDKAIRLNPHDASVYRNRGISYANLGQPLEANADKDQACFLDKQYC